MLLGAQSKGHEDFMKTTLFFPRIFRLRFSMKVKCLKYLFANPGRTSEIPSTLGSHTLWNSGPHSQKSNSEASSVLSRLLSYFFWNKYFMITSFCKIARRMLSLIFRMFCPEFHSNQLLLQSHIFLFCSISHPLKQRLEAWKLGGKGC